MPRSELAYLEDILDSCDGIDLALHGADLDEYNADRVMRRAVEREFMIIGEAVNVLSRMDPELAGGISHARRIVAFRNELAHGYASIHDRTVWAIANKDAPVLRAECFALLQAREGADQP